MEQTLYIRNMVCNRCITVVNQLVRHLGFTPLKVALGEVVIDRQLSVVEKEILQNELQANGFDIIEERKAKHIEKIKNSIIFMVHQEGGITEKRKLSEVLTHELALEYSYLSAIFSEQENCTIEKYFILQKIERIKELISYDEFSLKEIAEQLHYSSTSHLSFQFKKMTGQTISAYKKQPASDQRQPLDTL